MEPLTLMNSFTIGSIVFGIYLILLTLIFRFKKRTRPLIWMGTGTLIGIVVIFIPPLIPTDLYTVHHPLISDKILAVALILLLFTGLCYAYFQFYGILQFSITFRMLRLMLKKYPNDTDLKAMQGHNAFVSLIESKLLEAEKMGLLKIISQGEGKIIQNTPSGKRTAQISRWVKSFFNWGHGG